MRYLLRFVNPGKYAPGDTPALSRRIRRLLGSNDAIGHLRVSSQAIEFDLFARDSEELRRRQTVLEAELGRALTVKLLDKVFAPRDKLEVLNEGIDLFNEERFWECHEVLEQIWQPARGAERNLLQGLILTAAALVHAQKDENDVALSMLKKAIAKLDAQKSYHGVDVGLVKAKIAEMLEARLPRPFRIEMSEGTA